MKTHSPDSSTDQNTSRLFKAHAPKFAQLTEDVLFGDIWERTTLTKRERSIATVTALIALYRLEQLPFHLRRAVENGVTREELSELITHLAFYAGWPVAASAIERLSELPETTKG